MRPPYRSASWRAERFGQRSQRPPPMAHGILLRWRGFPERSFELIAEEQRVVAEAAVASRRFEDAPAAGALEHLRYRVETCEVHQHAAVAGSALRFGRSAQSPDELGVVGGVDLGGSAGRPRPAT